MSVSDDPRTSAEVVGAIAEKATAVRNSALALTDRIKRYQKYLGALEGRVEAIHWGKHPDDDDGNLELGLRFHRQGKEWIISWGADHAQANPDIPTDWNPLVDAPLKIKIASVDLFPELLIAIERSQRKLARQANKACDAFDEFAKTLNITEGK